MAACVKRKIPIFITSLCVSVKEIPDAVHSYGGIVLHDVINLHHAEKALEISVDGLIPVAAGASGRAGAPSPSVLVGEVRRISDGSVALSGAIVTGDAILAAQAMGADFAYIGTRLIVSQEAHVAESYKQAILRAAMSDTVYTNLFTSMHDNYICENAELAGLDPAALPETDKSKMNFGDGSSHAKARKDVWGADQGVSQIAGLPPAAKVAARMKAEYDTAKLCLALHPYP